MRSASSLTLAVCVAVGLGVGVLAWSGHDQSGGTVSGRVERVGGPAPGAAVAVRGVVTLTQVPSQLRFRAADGADGRFSLSVPTGDYRIEATTPDVVDHGRTGAPRDAVIVARELLRVRRATTTRVELVFSVK